MAPEEINDIEQLKKEIESKGQQVTDVNVLFLDLSSSCTGYVLVSVNFEKKSAKFITTGAIWFDDSWKNQEKYHYVFSAIVNYFNIVGQIDLCVCEAYMINRNKLMGSQVGPELHGAVQVALAEIGVKYYTILPQSWRKALGITPNVSINAKGKKEKDFKTPTKNFVLQQAPHIPPQIQSNITGNNRTTPTDVYDAMAVAMGFLNRLGVSKWDCKDLQIQTPINIP
jgi:Holliday junction resolvasome RuvABC endonuclease subunit